VSEVDAQLDLGGWCGIDDEAGSDEWRQRLGDVDRELGDRSPRASAKGIEISDAVQRQQKGVQTWAVANDDARVRTHLQMRGITT
jgi:hypothetical protein